MAEELLEREGAAFRDADHFREEVAALGRPVVLRGFCADWPAVAAGRGAPEALADYLGQFATGRPGEAFFGEPGIGGRYFYGADLDSFNFQRREMPLVEGLRHIVAAAADPGLGTVYMGSLPVDTYAPGFAAENRLHIVPDGVTARLWVGNASQVTCHYDTYENVACVLAGTRRFTLYPPDAIGDLYPGPLDRTMAGPPVSLAAAAAPDDARYPRFARARARQIVVDLQPGDALFLPKLWWHQVEAEGSCNLMANYWWDAFAAGPDAPMTALLLAMIAVADRPPAERAAWAAHFDHYVFRTGGHPLAHLPEQDHGMLGPLTPQLYGRLRAMIMQRLRGA